MSIAVNDVKLLKSQRLTDENDGGGRATGEAVTNGQVNNLFPDISRLDRTVGRINLRKVFAGVMTDNADAFLGAHGIVTQAPSDPRVSVLLFNTGSQTDERVAARSVIEGYVVPSTTASFELLGDQFAGQRAIVAIQREEMRQPEVGEVYQLLSGANSQYVRCVGVESELREFVYDYGNGNFINFQRRALTISISAPLGIKFPGGQPTPAGTTGTNLAGQAKSSVLATQVADSARYYGLSPLAVACSVGDMTLQAQSVYSQLVPSAMRESSLLDQIGGPRKRFSIAASSASRSVALTFAASATGGESRSFLGTGALRGSVVLTISGAVYQDDGTGELRLQSGSAGFTRVLVDYETGEITAFRPSVYTGAATAAYRVAAVSTGQAVTGEIKISLGNRGFAYTLNLADAKPRPGTLSVSYMALGKWYEMRDNGSGELVGQGSGSVNFATGSVAVSLNALPDVNSSLLYNYVGQDDFNHQIHVGTANPPKISVEHQLPYGDLEPGSVTVTTLHGGVPRMMTSTPSGALSGPAGTGHVNHVTGAIVLELNATVDQGSRIEFGFRAAGPDQLPIDLPLTVSPDLTGIASGVIAGAPLKPGTVEMRWTSTRRARIPKAGSSETYTSDVLVSYLAVDDGSGNWLIDTGTVREPVAGSINYATGAFSLRVERQYDVPNYYVTYSR